jgi:hypothetical protein
MRRRRLKRIERRQKNSPLNSQPVDNTEKVACPDLVEAGMEVMVADPVGDQKVRRLAAVPTRKAADTAKLGRKVLRWPLPFGCVWRMFLTGLDFDDL